MSEEKAMKQISPELKLLDLTLKNASAIQSSLMGEFTAEGSQEIVVTRPGGALEVYKIESSDDGNDDDDEDEEEETRVWLKMVMRVETKSIIRSMEIMRLGGEKRDLILVGSDSGNVTVLDFEGGQSKILHCFAFGKTGELVFVSFMLPFYPMVPSTDSNLFHFFFFVFTSVHSFIFCL